MLLQTCPLWCLHHTNVLPTCPHTRRLRDPKQRKRQQAEARVVWAWVYLLLVTTLMTAMLRRRFENSCFTMCWNDALCFSILITIFLTAIECGVLLCSIIMLLHACRWWRWMMRAYTASTKTFHWAPTVPFCAPLLVSKTIKLIGELSLFTSNLSCNVYRWLWTVCFFFNWIGLLACMCFIRSIAGRFGALSGFGLSLVKWVVIIKVGAEHAKVEAMLLSCVRGQRWRSMCLCIAAEQLGWWSVRIWRLAVVAARRCW